MNIKFQSDSMTIVEFEPSIRTIQHFYGRFRLSFPYTIFIVNYCYRCYRYNFGALNLVFSKKPIKSFEDKVFIVKFPNQSNMKICMYSQASTPKIDKTVEQAISEFWQSRFSYLIGFYPNRYEAAKETLTKWAKKTKKNPNYCPPSISSGSLKHFIQVYGYSLRDSKTYVNHLGKI